MAVPVGHAATTTCPADQGSQDTSFGFNVKQDTAVPWDSPTARRSLAELGYMGVREVSLVVFLSQATPEDTHVVLGIDTRLPALARAIRYARAAGLCVTIKPHIWVPGHWAGDIRPRDEAGMARWFTSYERVMTDLADLAEREGAARFVIATELTALAGRPEWPDLSERLAGHFHGELEWIADKIETAERFIYWNSFSAISVSLYPVPAPGERTWQPALKRSRTRLTELSHRCNRPIRIAEIGVRSVVQALSAPWQRTEQRRAPVDLELQTRAYSDVFDTFSGAVASVHFWCWYTNPAIGGRHDSGFTPRGKPVAAMLKQRLLPATR